MSTLTGLLHVKDNLHDIQALDGGAPAAPVKRPAGGGGTLPTPQELLKKVKYEWGPLDVEMFLKKLQQDGGSEVRVEEPSPGCMKIVLVGEDTHIRLEEGNSHIVCGGKQSLRLKLRDLLLQCVHKF